MKKLMLLCHAVILIIGVSCAFRPARTYDVVIMSGEIYDGSGESSYVADIGIKDDRIAAIGQLQADADLVIDARGLAVAPGFINMLSWANETLIQDGRSQSDIRQGVTLEVIGEGQSMGPLNETMKQEMKLSQGGIPFNSEWTTLGEYLDLLENRGVSTNIASFVGAATVRAYVMRYEERQPTARELEQMCSLVGQAMQEGAMGVSSALIYTPGAYADTDELIALAGAAGEQGGMYISHIRSEGDRLLEALDELITIGKRADLAVELYHMKAAGQANWHKLDAMIERIEQARANGLSITANMYTYTAGATGLDAAMPPWVQAGGHQAWMTRLKDPVIRQRVLKEMRTASAQWENLFLLAGTPENIVLTEFRSAKLRHFTGKTLGAVARMRGTSPAETAIDLVVEDNSRIGAVYVLMSEENVKRQIRLPWVSFCSDAGSPSAREAFLQSNIHPRAYGNFARLLGKYVRQDKLITLAEAIRRLTSLPAENLKLEHRGGIKKGYYADLAIFDPETIIDHATYEKPHQYATGMVHVFVNGTQVLKDGKHTGAKPGRVVRGPGWKSDS
jgi:N-acyl-D-amino-acid deacylase